MDLTIKSSYNYDQFSFLPGNRELKPAHIRTLRESIKQNAGLGRYRPILVNHKMQIIDGQHTFKAREQENLPIYYLELPEGSLEDVQRLNSNAKNWSPVDYAQSYADLGNDNYAFYLELRAQFHLNHDVLLRYISLDLPISGEMFKKGQLMAANRERSRELAEMLSQVGHYYPRYNIRSFALAFLQVSKEDGYDHRRMIDKLKLRGDTIADVGTRELYIVELENVYNWKCQNGNKLRFNYN